MSPADLDDMAGLLGDPAVMRYYPRPRTRDEALGWIEWNRRLYNECGFGLWRISLLETGEFVGDCGLTLQEVEGQTEIEVGYHVKPELWCNGLATEGATACTTYATEVLDVDRVVAIIDPRNAASQRVAQKIGMRREGEITYAGRVAHLFALERSAPCGPVLGGG